MLGEIALEEGKPAEARRAVFVLAQSGHPEAQMVVVDVAKKGPRAVRMAAVKELGHFGGPEIAKELLQVYSTADLRGEAAGRHFARAAERRERAAQDRAVRETIPTCAKRQ